MAKKIAFLFPGQGSQAVGMGKDLYDNFEAAKNVFDSADKILGKSITTLCFEGPEENLKQTVNTQPCIVTMSIAALEALKSQLDITPTFTAGHSLGEYCAMYCSGVMNLETTLKAIQKRADLMGATKGGAMAAILNAPEGSLEKALKEASEVGYVDVANYNSPAQVVITGDENAVKKAGELLSEAGARRVVPLAVSGAFHSKFMEEAGHEFALFVQDLDMENAQVPVFTNVDAQATMLSAEFKNKMPKQIYSSVHWTQTIENMIKDGVDTFIEIGPGKVLAGLNRKIDSSVKSYNIYDKESLESTINALKEEMALA
ncbi:MAG: [acyl-carrier-protein] S-malonyltransferase [Candidatus Melainabacteria bacterium]|nr:MAG: [acyl-carrier-protein] S-malonyltransferase [Candidatus Melainabacteria bacterium]